MKKRKIPIALILGAVLIFVSLSFVITYQIRIHVGEKQCRAVASKMQELLPERSLGIPGTYPSLAMPSLQIDGTDYVALLEIPSMNVSLPVADKWNGKKLFDSPARFCGSAYDSSLVIGGRDQEHQFAFCDKIDNGTVVIITDMTGAQFTYTVKRVDRSDSAKSAWLADGEFDLTLFCRDAYSTKYIAVRCVFAYK